jgi:hypothetical protein
VLFAALISRQPAASAYETALLGARPADNAVTATLRAELRALVQRARADGNGGGGACRLATATALNRALRAALPTVVDGDQQDAEEFYTALVAALGAAEDARVTARLMLSTRVVYTLATGDAMSVSPAAPRIESHALLRQEASAAAPSALVLERDLVPSATSQYSLKSTRPASPHYEHGVDFGEWRRRLRESVEDVTAVLARRVLLNDRPLTPAQRTAAVARFAAAEDQHSRIAERVELTDVAVLAVAAGGAAPQTLAFRLFLFEGQEGHKRMLRVGTASDVDAAIVVTVAGVAVRPPLQSSETVRYRYELRSLVAHIGATRRRGHYVAMARDGGGAIVLYDDIVGVRSEADSGWAAALQQLTALGATPYLLFYERAELLKLN